MNGALKLTFSQRKSGGFTLIELFVVVSVLFVLISMTGLLEPLFTVPLTLVFGWIAFLWRTIPLISINLELTVWLLVCIVMILLGLHSFCRWFVAHQKVGVGRWPASATGRLFGIFLLVLMSVMGLTGFTHQVAWLGTTEDKWLVGHYQRHMSVKHRTRYFIQKLGEDTAPLTVEKLQGAFIKSPFFESDRLYWVADDTGHVKTIVRVPRDPKEENFAFSHNLGEVETLPIDQLKDFLKKNDGDSQGR